MESSTLDYGFDPPAGNTKRVYVPCQMSLPFRPDLVMFSGAKEFACLARWFMDILFCYKQDAD